MELGVGVVPPLVPLGAGGVPGLLVPTGEEPLVDPPDVPLPFDDPDDEEPGSGATAPPHPERTASTRAT